ncbi:hypothetical protein GJ496_008094, partial [Pomphorhynchus laevis]
MHNIDTNVTKHFNCYALITIFNDISTKYSITEAIYDICLNTQTCCKSNCQPCQEIISIIKKYQIDGVLQAYKVIANELFNQETSDNINTNNMSQITSPMMNSSARFVRVVNIKRHDDEPLGFTLKIIDEKCIVTRVMFGSIIHKSGHINVGDEILEINSTPVNCIGTSQLHSHLRSLENSVTIKIRIGQYRNYSPCNTYVKALFDFDPAYDELIPFAKAGVSFKLGNILQIISKDDYNWWQARLIQTKSSCFVVQSSMVDLNNEFIGLIPSSELQESRQLVKPQTNILQLQAANCGFFGRRRRYKEKYLARHHALFDQMDMLTYEEVVQVAKFRRKTVVLIGAHGVGRRHIKNVLLTKYPNIYAYPIP